ncbi:hypothetical protein CROQUDRAFT_654683 [Cronartium quercuum f. sp. fusiforme G11]|uniref:Heme haloperoxidase family profile domain-containing protein n=1 Tax=Cronartium quercuum f. sp. fusiforme G11 TaxID=708437 RepID=A0A9P6TFB1_9BASI|nr:hypothetical protein CROQUDRAFT_654683 [Cronartium quercuum f. sp. fusiforme G11]
MWSLTQTILILFISVRLGKSFPQILGRRAGGLNGQNVSVSDFEHLLKSRQILSNSLGSLVGIIPTTLDLAPVASIGRKRIPDEDHPFRAPGPDDIRGGCPGLNILANYGYISRDGITTVSELIYGMQEMLGFGADLATVLAAVGLLTSVDLTTLKISIGKTDSRTDGPLSGLFGTAPGLFSTEAHGKFEVDGSLAYVDAYFANGDTFQFDSNRWRKYRQLAVNHFEGVMTTKWVGAVRDLEYHECRDKNPRCNWNILNQLVFYLGQAFIPNLMTSADADGNPLPADVKSIETFFGLIENPDGSFTHGHSRLPPGPDGHFYRRAVPATLAQVLTTLTDTLLAYPVEFGSNDGTLGHWNPSLTQIPNIVELNIICYLLQQTRDPKNSRYADNEPVSLALGKLLRNSLQPIFEQLSC